jgi:hypothetical protein
MRFPAQKAGAHCRRRQGNGMPDFPEPCGFPSCSHSAALTLQLLVEGEDVAMRVCQQHAQWLRIYAEEDPNVQLVDEDPERSRQDPPGTPVT